MKIEFKGVSPGRVGGAEPGVVGWRGMIQITPQMRILVAVEPVDGRKGIDSLAQLCQERLLDRPFLGLPVRFPQPARNRDSHSRLRRPGILAGAEAAFERAFSLVAGRAESARGGAELWRHINCKCCWRQVIRPPPRRRRHGDRWWF